MFVQVLREGREKTRKDIQTSKKTKGVYEWRSVLRIARVRKGGGQRGSFKLPIRGFGH